jgi:hypothetical protein
MIKTTDNKLIVAINVVSVLKLKLLENWFGFTLGKVNRRILFLTTITRTGIAAMFKNT